MNATIKDILQFVEENDVKFIKLTFCDLFGRAKNVSIMPYLLEEAFTEGISFAAYGIQGFTGIKNSDLLLVPDPTTLSVLPWRPSGGRVIRFYCDIKNPNGTPFENDTRNLLKNVVSYGENLGYTCKIGSECEFYLFKTDENGNPTTTPLDNGDYFDIAPIDKGENIRREICLCLEEMGISPETSHHERGPGQNEIDFHFADSLTAADDLVTFKTVVKTISERNGLYASFLPKPLFEKSGNGLHINVSLYKNGENIFKVGENEHNPQAESFIAGILNHIDEITAFLNPLPTSYLRLGSWEAPKFISWSHQNRSQLIRIPLAKGSRIRMELRSPDPCVNPYLAFSLVLMAGFKGIENGLKLPKSIDCDLFSASEEITKNLKQLPLSLSKAIEIAENSEFVKNTLPIGICEKYFALKKAENSAYINAIDKTQFCKETYFGFL